MDLDVEISGFTLGNKKMATFSRNLEIDLAKSVNNTETIIFTDNLSPEEESVDPEVSLLVEDNKEELEEDSKSFDRGVVELVDVTRNKTDVIEFDIAVEEDYVRQVETEEALR